MTQGSTTENPASCLPAPPQVQPGWTLLRVAAVSSILGVGTLVGALLLVPGSSGPIDPAAMARANPVAALAAIVALGAWILTLAALPLQRKRGQRDIRALRVLRDTIETSSAAIAVYDQDETLITCNATYRRIYAEAFSRVTAPIRFEALMRADTARLPPAEAEIEVQRRLGQHRNLTGQGIEVAYPAGPTWPDGTHWQLTKRRLVGGEVASVAVDISEGKARERELSLLHQCLEATPFAFAVFDRTGQIVSWNHSYQELHATAFKTLAHPFRYADLVAACLPEDLTGDERKATERLWLEQHQRGDGASFDRAYGERWFRMSKQRLACGEIATFAVDVTEIKRRDEELRRLQEAIAATPIQVALFESDGRLGFANPSLVALLKADGVEVADGPSYADCARALLPAGLEGEAAEAELTNRLAAHIAAEGRAVERLYPDGRWRSVTQVMLSDGAIAGFAVDIHAQKLREQELQLLHESITDTPFPFALYGADQVLLAWNRSYQDLYRQMFETLQRPFTYQALVDASLPADMDPDARASEIARRVAIHEAGSRESVDRLYQDGRWRRVTKVRLSSGAVAGFAVDIHELKQREAELERSEGMFRALAETVPVAIWRIDREGQTGFMNPTLVSMLGSAPPVDLRYDTALLDAPMIHQLAGRRFESDLAIDGQVCRRVLVVTSPWLADRSGAETCLAALIDITELNEAQRTIELFALHDPLTALKNRTGFGRVLEANVPKATEEHPVALLALDLDLFKEVNDRFGHAAGDRVLREVADRMRAVFDGEPGISRLGGDEFAILVRADRARAEELADRILADISRPIELDIGFGEVGASIGIALAPLHAADIETLLRYADLSLYRAKALGRDRVVVFDASLEEEVQSRRRIEGEILTALDADEFRLVFQPQFNAGTGHLTGVEALLRWNNPRIGRDISPGQFIPVAEATGLIPMIDGWVLERATRQVAAWRAAGHSISCISVNVSPASLREPDFAQHVIDCLRSADLAPEALELEVTEGVVLADRAQASEVLHRLRGLGVGIALDDFGAGYASLGQIKALPLSRLKIDRSLVDRVSVSERDAAIVRAIAALGTALGLPTLAEGVETEDQLAAIRRLGCTEVQGFLWGVPLEAEQFRTTWLTQRKAAIGDAAD